MPTDIFKVICLIISFIKFKSIYTTSERSYPLNISIRYAAWSIIIETNTAKFSLGNHGKRKILLIFRYWRQLLLLSLEISHHVKSRLFYCEENFWKQGCYAEVLVLLQRLHLLSFGAEAGTHFAHAKYIVYNLCKFPCSSFIAMITFILNWSLYMCYVQHTRYGNLKIIMKLFFSKEEIANIAEGQDHLLVFVHCVQTWPPNILGFNCRDESPLC